MSIILKPHITEKAATLATKRQYPFIVHKKANKIDIKKAIQQQYNVAVDTVNTARYHSKKIVRYTKKNVHKGQKSLYKKAIITLKEGQVLNLQSQTL